MKIQVVTYAPALGRMAAAHVARAARQAVSDRGRFTVAFSGGSTPAAMLEALAGQALPWDRIEVLQVDERVAPEGHPDRNLELLRRHLLQHVPIPPHNVHPMPVTDLELETAAERYAETLRQVCGTPPTLDLVHLGLGRDGHTASLLPGDPAVEVTDRDVATTGHYRGRRRMTLTLPALNRARSVLWLVTGEKAAAVRRLVDANPSIPAAHVARERAVLLADTAAAAAIRPPRPTIEE